MNVLEVLRPGLMSTVQDLGRFGYGSDGIPFAGAMDPMALQIGNILVGNKRDEAGLEMTFIGIKARVLAPALMAVTGGKGNFTLNGNKISLWKSFSAKPGDILDISGITEGARSYLAIAGGITVPKILGSRSTYTPAGFGGFKGRALKAGDRLPGKSLKKGAIKRALAASYIPEYPNIITLRVIPGLSEGLFSPSSLNKFYSELYNLTSQSNRMGFRLRGWSLDSVQKGHMVSDAVVRGTIQVPPNGQPIILTADHQTTGGYPIAAVVANADFSKLAQLPINGGIRFVKISGEEAEMAKRVQEKFLRNLEIAVMRAV